MTFGAALGTPPRWRVTAFALSVALATACGSSSPAAGRPRAVPPGTPIGSAVAQSIAQQGGSMQSLDGRITLNVPAKAVTQPTSFSVQEITNTAPRGIGSAYRLEPSGKNFVVPVAITFRTDSVTTPLDHLGISYQDGSGYWVSVPFVLRNRTSKLITVSTSHFTDWSLVSIDPTQDMSGTFTLASSVNVAGPFTAVGNVSLSYTGEDSIERVFLLNGTATLQPVTRTAGVCTADSDTKNLTPNVAEVFKSPAHFDWGASALWDLTCGGTPDFIEMVFDTAGISHVGCAHGYTYGAPTPVVTQDQLTGDYTIDCTSQGTGTMRASWNFTRCGSTCTSTNPCALTATVTCTSSGTTCTDATFATAGTACTVSGTAGVCSSTGVCTACTQGATCTSTDPCVATATIDCSSGAAVCTAQTYQPAGTACTSGTTTGVCSGPTGNPPNTCAACTQGASCTSTNACAVIATIDCSSGAPVCTDQTFQTAGTACTTSGGAAGVCSPSSSTSPSVCTACTQGATCTSTNPCATTATIDCSGGTPVCKDQTYQPSGTACVIGTTSGVCEGNVCTACPGAQGAPCTSTDSCAATATIDCSTGAPVCAVQTYQPAGTACTSGTTSGVCSGPTGNPPNTCTACTQGASCTSTNPCALNATIDCSTGTPVCTDQTYEPVGTTCTSGTSTGQCTSTGTCSICTPGATCTSTNPCATAASITCSSTGAPLCTDTSYQPDATVCDTSGDVCLSGNCSACISGASCVPSANPCDVGTLDCGTPGVTAPTCVDTAVAITCPTGQTCVAGKCQ